MYWPTRMCTCTVRTSTAIGCCALMHATRRVSRQQCYCAHNMYTQTIKYSSACAAHCGAAHVSRHRIGQLLVSMPRNICSSWRLTVTRFKWHVHSLVWCTGIMKSDDQAVVHKPSGRRRPDRKVSKKSVMKFGRVAFVKRCPHCATPMQKNDGCNHMTCRCGKSFCWTCGGKYTVGDHSSCQAYHGFEVRSWINSCFPQHVLHPPIHFNVSFITVHRMKVQI